VRLYAKVWTAIIAVNLAMLVAGALLLRRSFGLTALSDVTQCVLLLSGTFCFIPHALRSKGRLRLFWSLLASGIGLWFVYQLFWTYFEVWLRQDVPYVFTGDIVLFLHIVPLMAALALRPHAPEDSYGAGLRHLDFALLFVFWIYLYVVTVIPWQYVISDSAVYNRNLNSLYTVEKLAFVVVLILCYRSSEGGWKSLYANFFGATVTYGISSYVANYALSRHAYYTGSLYDVPLAVSMAWVGLIGFWTRAREPRAGITPSAPSHGVSLARLGMIVAFSLPLFAAWALTDRTIPAPMRDFRVVVTFSAALLMGLMVFIRQRLLDRELLRLLINSRDSVDHLKRLQVQITESEKLASIGQLVGGVAHELNNPITALLGYSDLLLCTPMTPGQKEVAERLAQHARRTRSLVASLLSFATQKPTTISAVDLNSLLRTAIKLSEGQRQSLKVDLSTNTAQGLLLVRGDSNQLLQVCVQTIGDALVAASQQESGFVRICAGCEDGFAVVKISTEGRARNIANNQVLEEVKQTGPDAVLSGLGLTACQGILKQHHGHLSWKRDQSGAVTISIEIPVSVAAREKSNEGGLPTALQPQPSA
jgi:signal transduction histidine kinase